MCLTFWYTEIIAYLIVPTEHGRIFLCALYTMMSKELPKEMNKSDVIFRGSMFILKFIFFWEPFSGYTPMGSGVARRAAAHVTPKFNMFMHTIFFKSVAPRLCMPKEPFCFFCGQT